MEACMAKREIAMQKVVIPGLTRNLGSFESVELTGFRIRSGMTEIKDSDFLQKDQACMAKKAV